MANFWFKFEWDIWRNDRQLRRCSKETRGFWIDCIAAMEDAQTYFLEGTPEEICRDVVADRGEFDRSIAELLRHGAATIEIRQGVCGVKDVKSQEIVKIVCRRLLKKLNLTEYNTLKKREQRDRERSSECQVVSSKDIDSKSLRALDSTANAVEVQTQPERKIPLPINFKPPEDVWEWGISECPSLNLNEELDEFVTFWRDIATKNNKRTLRGWNATWKNRMKERQAKLGASNGRPNHGTINDRINSYRPILDQYQPESEPDTFS